MKPLSRRMPRWFRSLNLLLAVIGLAFAIAFPLVGLLLDRLPYDYVLLMRASGAFCSNDAAFEYGRSLHIYYPGPFYTTFCLPYQYANPVLVMAWLVTPVVLALWLARGRAAVLAYPPLFVLLLIGQSSWLLMPAFILAASFRAEQRTPWWHGLALALCIFKPHIAGLVVLYLLYQWWRYARPAFWTALISMTLITLPSFLIRPTWLLEWLPSGRGFEPVNLASIAFVPVQALGLGFAPGPGGQAVVYMFCLIIGVALYGIMRAWRGHVSFEDGLLIFLFVNPFLNDYDLVVLLPFICKSRKRLLLALVGGLLGWAFALVSLRWSMSFFGTLALVLLRLYESYRSRSSLTPGEPTAIMRMT